MNIPNRHHKISYYMCIYVQKLIQNFTENAKKRRKTSYKGTKKK